MNDWCDIWTNVSYTAQLLKISIGNKEKIILANI